MKVRNIRPDPIRSTNASATSATTTPLRKPAAPSAPVRPPARNMFMRSGLAVRSAGTTPKRTVEARPANTENASTNGSMWIALRRGRLAGAMASNSRMPITASATPATVLSEAMTSASARVCRTSGHQPAPSAARTANSRSRNEVRTSIKFATFAQAISIRKITAPISARIAGRTSLTRCCFIGSRRKYCPAVREMVFSWRIFSAIVSASAWACSMLTPGFRRAMTRHCTLLRLATS